MNSCANILWAHRACVLPCARSTEWPSLLGHVARVLPLEPGHGTQISAPAQTKGYVQTGARAPILNRALDAV